jgi:hypothetical protein
VQVQQALARVAFRPDAPCRVLALATLGGHAVLKLDLIESLALLGAGGDGLVADPVTHADNHGRTPEECRRMIIIRNPFGKGFCIALRCEWKLGVLGSFAGFTEPNGLCIWLRFG